MPAGEHGHGPAAGARGAGAYGTRNGVAVLTPPGRAPIVHAVMSSRSVPGAEHDDEHDDALLAAAAEVVTGARSAERSAPTSVR